VKSLDGDFETAAKKGAWSCFVYGERRCASFSLAMFMLKHNKSMDLTLCPFSFVNEKSLETTGNFLNLEIKYSLSLVIYFA
jgi:hypothetical protein